MRISVGSPILTISHNRTFMVSDLNGQILSNHHQGIFADDTRFLSYYACYIDGNNWIRLSSTTTTYYAARIYLTNPEFTSRNGKITEGSVSLIISRTVEEGIHEELDLTNYSIEPVSFNLEISLRSDFADIFEVDTRQFVRRGKIETIWNLEKQQLSTRYDNGDFYRCLIYQISQSTSTPHYANGRITFEVKLAPKALCELQGYVYDAWMRMSEIFTVLGENDVSHDLKSKALKIRHLFEEHFWCEDIGFYAFTLDGDKQPVKTISSNVGHCLWSGIISPERAEKVVKRLFKPDM
jgi:glycogen debranching enzyme